MDLFQVGRVQRVQGEGREGGEGCIKGFRMCHVHIPISHNACNHYVSQTWTKKMKKGGGFLETEKGRRIWKAKEKRIKTC